jgi:hypothetical protein
MALPVFQRSVVTDTGNIIPNAQVTVTDTATGGIVTLFADAGGNTGLANPFNATSEGFARFYANPGVYNVTATGAQGTIQWTDVHLIDTADIIAIGENFENIETVADSIQAVETASDNIQAIIDAPQAATEAENSATAADNSATTAANSATASANSATDSANSATASANSATASANSASAALTSENNAATSESNASNSEIAAANSASAASTSATNAGNSATAADNSATAAEGFKDDAETAAASVDAQDIVHAPNSGLPNSFETLLNNTLTSTSTAQALTANQGKVLNDKINNFAADGVIPLGGIIAIRQGLTGAHPIPASGVVDSSGFMYCDGTAIPSGNAVSGNTPSLTDGRFLRGATSSGATGGSDSFTLAVGNLPAHSHSGTTASNGSHSHTGTANSAGAHTHTYVQNSTTSTATTYSGAPGGYLRNTVTANTSSSGAHTHSLSINSNGAHTHTFTTNNTGSGTAVSHIPKYFDVVYLMRVN